MSFFVQPTTSAIPKTKNIRKIGLFLTVILVIFAVTQLFNFDKFSTILTVLALPGGAAFAKLHASLFAILEVAAIPFLLSMKLSPAARFLSMAAGWLVVASWLFVAIWANVTLVGTPDSGLFGGIIPMLAGWWMVFFFLGLGILVAWVSWGMWPHMGGVKKR